MNACKVVRPVHPIHIQPIAARMATVVSRRSIMPQITSITLHLQTGDAPMSGSTTRFIDWDTINFVPNDPNEDIWLGVRSGRPRCR
jgi:hypothetical protein